MATSDHVKKSYIRVCLGFINRSSDALTFIYHEYIINVL